MPMPDFEPEEFADMVFGAVKEALAPLTARVEELEKRLDGIETVAKQLSELT